VRLVKRRKRGEVGNTKQGGKDTSAAGEGPSEANDKKGAFSKKFRLRRKEFKV